MVSKNPLADEATAETELHELNDRKPSAPSYEEALKSPYPVLPSTSPGTVALEGHQLHMHQPIHHHHHSMHQPQPVCQNHPTTIVGQPQMVVHHSPPVGPKPTMLVCPACKRTVQTKVKYVSNAKTHLMALLLCLFGYGLLFFTPKYIIITFNTLISKLNLICRCWCCVWCPYCIDECKNGIHSCPNCGAFVGTYK